MCILCFLFGVFVWASLGFLCKFVKAVMDTRTKQDISLVWHSFPDDKSKEYPHSKSITNDAVQNVLEGKRACMSDTCMVTHSFLVLQCKVWGTLRVVF